MVTQNDIDKQCFVKFKVPGKDTHTWENVGARIVGIHHDRNKVILKMPGGERIAVDIEDVRVLEPRPA